MNGARSLSMKAFGQVQAGAPQALKMELGEQNYEGPQRSQRLSGQGSANMGSQNLTFDVADIYQGKPASYGKLTSSAIYGGNAMPQMGPS